MCVCVSAFGLGICNKSAFWSSAAPIIMNGFLINWRQNLFYYFCKMKMMRFVSYVWGQRAHISSQSSTSDIFVTRVHTITFVCTLLVMKAFNWSNINHQLPHHTTVPYQSIVHKLNTRCLTNVQARDMEFCKIEMGKCIHLSRELLTLSVSLCQRFIHSNG